MSDSANLTTLPPELILRIFECDAISHHELRSLRLTCHSLSGPTTQVLFSRIGISKLHSDREAFLNIAIRPHLACAVQTLVWYELAEDELSFIHLHNPRSAIEQTPPANSRDRPQFAADMEQELSSITSQARVMFWLPFEDHVQYQEERELENKKAKADARTEAIDDFMGWFYVALDHMPKLTTFISKPMHPQRELRMPSGYIGPYYPMTAQIFQRGMCSTRAQMNEGFCTFMMPYISHRARRREDKGKRLLPINRLHLADEGHFSFITRLGPEFKDSFACLDRIDLCISQLETVENDLTGLAACLRAATNLTELRLCFERCESLKGPTTSAIFDTIFPESCFDPVSAWPNLRLLHLVDIPFSTDSLVRVAKGLARSLKILRVDIYPMKRQALECLAKISELKLESFVVTFEHGIGDDYYQPITEQMALGFINGESQWPLPSRHRDPEKTCIYTHDTVFDLHSWRTAAIFDSRDSPRGYSIADMREMEQEDADEVDTYEDIHEQTPSETESSSDETGDDDEDEENHGNDAAEVASHRRRLLSAPRWNWTQASDGNVYYWEVLAQDVRQQSYPTGTWLFTHRNGEQALGDDPLEFWSDWGGSEAGDVAEATPRGLKFDHYVELAGAWEDTNEILIPFGRALKWDSRDGAN